MHCLSVPVTNPEAAGGAKCHPQFLAVCQCSCSAGRNCLSPRGRHCLPEGNLTSSVQSVPPHRHHPALHTRDPAALGLPSHMWGRFQNQSVGLICVVYPCNTLNSNTCQLITEVGTAQNFCGYSEHSIIYCKLHHN